MQILPTYEFLAKKLGLVHGNPFSETQAEEEDQLTKYFVDLPAFYKILDLDTGKLKSSILSASRGCGKSANRRNVQRWLMHGPKQGYSGTWPWELPVLVVQYTDFSRLKINDDRDFSKIRPEDHVIALLWICVSALLEYLKSNWGKNKHKETPNWLISQLGFFLINYTTKWAYTKQLKPNAFSKELSLDQTLDSFLYKACSFAQKMEPPVFGGSTSLLQGFKEVAVALGVKSIVILVDGVDELDMTANDPRMGAALLRSLIAERTLMQLDGIYFKFFLPNQVVSELKKLPETRLGERHKFFEIHWDQTSIQLLLSERLKAFSNGALQDLGQLASPDLTDISSILAFHSQNNPRNLLRLCNWLLIHLEKNTPKLAVNNKKQKPRITQSIMDAAIKSFDDDIDYATTYPTIKSQIRNDNLIFSDCDWGITADLKITHKNKVVSSEKMDQTEYKILSYLIQHADKLVSRDELKNAIWGSGEGVSESALNQPIYRLRKKIGPDRIETVTGMGYIFHA